MGTYLLKGDMNDMDDKEIIELYNNRDEKAIEETSTKYGNFCYTIAYNILSDKEDSEECLNDTWLGVWNSIPPTQPKSLKYYLAGIVRNLSLKLFVHILCIPLLRMCKSHQYY